ncbi:hypothetical protein BV25DRAFT_1991029 [Artomyces pyxidatus]|uniref:Uncharacterized protein n=1 Tax=Artomyces pyxidatus TaxID=48021 RepID=A0ACB8T3J4_9AGAM|nr:hypothetical protein BV25DRAFT_1991029 [Artomyces pyxidatus]
MARPNPPPFYLTPNTTPGGARHASLADLRFPNRSDPPRHHGYHHEPTHPSHVFPAGSPGQSVPAAAHAWSPHFASLTSMFPDSHGGRADINASDSPSFHLSTPHPMAIPPQRPPHASRYQSDPSEVPEHADTPAEPVRAREKKHSCAMCHKSFDRPSTLRKHLLVHTGEKAFACDTCGRRFGVASNLNRHVKRCVLRPVHALHSGGGAQNEASGSSAIPDDSRVSSVGPTPSPPASEAAAPPKPRVKRRRRAPSPVQWVPPSLLQFDLTLFQKSCPVPLTPVLPCDDGRGWEERDSYDDPPPFNPYHPDGWRGKLPGPGRDIVNTSMSMSLGRLIVC